MMLSVLMSRAGTSAWRRCGSLARPGVLAAFLVLPGYAGRLYSPAESFWSGGATGNASCDMRKTPRLLAPYAGEVVLAEMNLGPELLYRTQVKIVGGLYMRGLAGAMRLRNAWRARDLDHVPPELLATGARYVLACPGTQRSLFVDGPATTLFDRLNRDDPPVWLEPIAGAPRIGWVLYRVILPDRAAVEKAG